MRVAYLVLGVLLLLCLLPVLLAAAAVLIARAAGCIPEGMTFTTCRILGTDWAEALTTSLTLHWLGLFTLPIAAALAALLLLLALIDLLRRLFR
ncbi:hypothetical protein C0V75_16945 [Tabrizicola sp. TH137]|uniref:hypothetical protein n=1 Tax=Tabrizicola sp. TH137 TaxID=2067452 RepID=UPI000C7B28CF|nr:hypothetical protein [Tabrizicola sp. TH137]PLL10992.1 hypothetical protein C0V75_16945 [Tabrizicola sp. TH137]